MKTWKEIVLEKDELSSNVKKFVEFIKSSIEAHRYDSMKGDISFFDGKRQSTFMFPTTSSGKQIQKNRELRIKWWDVGGIDGTDYIEDIEDIKVVFKAALNKLKSLKPAVVNANAYNGWKDIRGFFTKDGSEPKHIFTS